MTEEIVSDYDVRSPASRTLITVIGTLLAVGVILGLLLGASILMKKTTSTTSVVKLDNVAQIVVRGTSADIRIVPGADADAITVHAKVTSGLKKTDYQLGRKGDELKVVSDCLSWLSPGCGVSLTIEVPKDFPILVETTSGDVSASEPGGNLTVSTASGDISATKLAIDELSAESRSGDISAQFVDQPFAFKATTSSGDISATIPSGKRTYTVTAESNSGDVTSGITSDDKGEGFIRATSKSGDIRLRGN